MSCPMPQASCLGVPLVEPPFLEGSGLPSLVPSPLWQFKFDSFLADFTNGQSLVEMVRAAAVVAVFLFLLCTFHSSDEAYHKYLCHAIKPIRGLALSAFFITINLFLQMG